LNISFRLEKRAVARMVRPLFLFFDWLETPVVFSTFRFFKKPKIGNWKFEI